MGKRNRRFWMGLAGRFGVPLLAGTIVVCLTSRTFDILHLILIAVGLALIYLEYRYCHDR